MRANAFENKGDRPGERIGHDWGSTRCIPSESIRMGHTKYRAEPSGRHTRTEQPATLGKIELPPLLYVRTHITIHTYGPHQKKCLKTPNPRFQVSGWLNVCGPILSCRQSCCSQLCYFIFFFFLIFGCKERAFSSVLGMNPRTWKGRKPILLCWSVVKQNGKSPDRVITFFFFLFFLNSLTREGHSFKHFVRDLSGD